MGAIFQEFQMPPLSKHLPNLCITNLYHHKHRTSSTDTDLRRGATLTAEKEKIHPTHIHPESSDAKKMYSALLMIYPASRPVGLGLNTCYHNTLNIQELT